jgi:hypothetical protein
MHRRKEAEKIVDLELHRQTLVICIILDRAPQVRESISTVSLGFDSKRIELFYTAH